MSTAETDLRFPRTSDSARPGNTLTCSASPPASALSRLRRSFASTSSSVVADISARHTQNFSQCSYTSTRDSLYESQAKETNHHPRILRPRSQPHPGWYLVRTSVRLGLRLTPAGRLAGGIRVLPGAFLTPPLSSSPTVILVLSPPPSPPRIPTPSSLAPRPSYSNRP